MATPKTVFITGCSSGIGLELFRLLAAEGHTVVGTALPSSYDEALETHKDRPGNAHLRALDVADFSTATALVREIEESIGLIDVLVNNAGICYRSTVEDMTAEDELRQMQVNYFGPMHLIRECLPSMRRRRSGRIINLSSVGGMMAMPTMASYSASKFALEGASEALWYELKPWNIHVTLVRPGFINSLAFTKVQYSRKKREGLSSPDYDQHYQQMTGFVEKVMRRTPCTSLTVAKSIVRIMKRKRPPLRAAGTPDAQLFYYFRRLLPRFVYHKLLYLSLPGIQGWGRPTGRDTDV